MTYWEFKNGFKGKNVLVAGGTGMIGIQLVKLLIEEEEARVRVAALDDHSRAHPKADFKNLDLRYLDNCENVCCGMDFVFNLLCVKGSPKVMKKYPYTVMMRMDQMNGNILDAARRCGARGFLFTSTVGVYPPTAEIMKDTDDIWATPPSKNDWFAGWSKRHAELQLQAWKIENDFNGAIIVRPTNTYGPYDNFDSQNAMVVPSLIKRAVSGENPLTVWGDGSAVKDLLYAKDAARGMLHLAKNAPGETVNLSTGRGVTIKGLVDIIISNLDKKPEINYDASKSAGGDKKRVLDAAHMRRLGFYPSTTLEEGIKETIEWYKKHHNETSKRYDIFNEI